MPVAFTAYLPTLAILDLPGPPRLPTWLVWCTPVAALAWVWAGGAVLWRWGTRHYQAGGAEDEPGTMPIIDVRTDAGSSPSRRKGRARRGRGDRRGGRRMTFRVHAGEAVGYIGANGAGKSTTIKMLTGILVPTSGTVRTCGLDPLPPPPRPGPTDRGRVRPAQPAVVGPAAARVVPILRRDPPPRRRPRRGRAPTSWSSSWRWASTWTPGPPAVASASGCAPRSPPRCCTPPSCSILDEPTIGLDVLSKAAAARVPAPSERAAHGTTLLLTTHDMGDIERLCDRVLVVDHGRLAYDGTLPGLAATVGARAGRWSSTWSRPPPDLAGIPGTEHLGQRGATGCASGSAFDAEDDDCRDGAGRGRRAADVRDLSVEEPDIEDVVRRIYLSR